MLDPVSRAIANAPAEDEEVSAEEERAVAGAREWLKHNKPIPHQEVLADLGFTLDDFGRRAARRFRRNRTVRTSKQWPRRLPGPVRPRPTFAPWSGKPRCESYTGWRASHRPKKATSNACRISNRRRFRLRVGAYRIRFRDRGDSIEIFAVKHRSGAYR